MVDIFRRLIKISTTAPSTLTFKLNLTNVTDKYYADALYRGHYIAGAGRLIQGTAVVSF